MFTAELTLLPPWTPLPKTQLIIYSGTTYNAIVADIDAIMLPSRVKGWRCCTPASIIGNRCQRVFLEAGHRCDPHKHQAIATSGSCRLLTRRTW